MSIRKFADEYPGDPEALRDALIKAGEELETEIGRLTDELGRAQSDIDHYAIRTIPKLEAEIKQLRAEINKLQAEYQRAVDKVNRATDTDIELERLRKENAHLVHQARDIDEQHRAEIERLRAANENHVEQLNSWIRMHGERQDEIEQLRAIPAKLRKAAKAGLIDDEHRKSYIQALQDCDAVAGTDVIDLITDWQPMENAPKDGTRILVSTNEDGVHIAYFESAWGCFIDEYGAPFGLHKDIEEGPWSEASFWMPLPAEPRRKE